MCLKRKIEKYESEDVTVEYVKNFPPERYLERFTVLGQICTLMCIKCTRCVLGYLIYTKKLK